MAPKLRTIPGIWRLCFWRYAPLQRKFAYCPAVVSPQSDLVSSSPEVFLFPCHVVVISQILSIWVSKNAEFDADFESVAKVAKKFTRRKLEV